MAAEEHLSDQFEIVHPRRLVRIAGRTYPAVHTLDPSDPNAKGSKVRAAWIPMENGQLLRVSHFADEPEKFYLHGPPNPGSEHGHHSLPNEEGRHRDFLRVHGAEMTSKMIDAESTRPLKPEERSAAREQLEYLRRRRDG